MAQLQDIGMLLQLHNLYPMMDTGIKIKGALHNFSKTTMAHKQCMEGLEELINIATSNNRIKELVIILFSPPTRPHQASIEMGALIAIIAEICALNKETIITRTMAETLRVRDHPHTLGKMSLPPEII